MSMSIIEIIQGDITKQSVDAIVNAAKSATNKKDLVFIVCFF